ncbi:hypothetical protein PENSPDRAFT_651249 [Peniophora sp. CONT]|nr:hypothetical protein PENSPDRAFT_651249 [Peniophora sp. CONT]
MMPGADLILDTPANIPSVAAHHVIEEGLTGLPSGAGHLTPTSTADASLHITLTPTEATYTINDDDDPAAIHRRFLECLDGEQRLVDLLCHRAPHDQHDHKCYMQNITTNPYDGSVHIRVFTEEQRDAWLSCSDTWIEYCLPRHNVPRTRTLCGHHVVVHRVPIGSNLDRDRIRRFNADVLSSPSSLLTVYWLSHKSHSAKKARSSIVLRVRTSQMADQLVSTGVSVGGKSLRTAHHTPRPILCYNCCRYGHESRDCHRLAICSICAGPHPIKSCACPCIELPCPDMKECAHVVLRCANCGGPHRAIAWDLCLCYPTV